MVVYFENTQRTRLPSHNISFIVILVFPYCVFLLFTSPVYVYLHVHVSVNVHVHVHIGVVMC